MSTFLEIQDDLLDYINRPASEMRDAVKREINNTILWMQRKHQFRLSERVIRLTYPSGSFKINIATACDGTPRDYKNVQLLGSSTANEGLNLYLRSYSEIMAQKMKYQRSMSPQSFDESDFSNNNIPRDEQAFASFVVRNHQHYVFFSGPDLGLYPTPSTDRYLLLNLHIFLDVLEDNADTNYLLDNCYDFILLKALKRFNIYLKTEQRIPIPAEEVADAWDSILQWDKEVVAGDEPTA